ncbi:MAG: indolepyruvate oxidoreductase subunit beta family protein [Proteobacteria bacterium]|nr:indolepyruvate oxidoreductase subunit beta family protein [Pseudomonadota bacterium]
MTRPITLTVAALGGQGGGVVTDWLVLTARSADYLAQATSVPGVAQRTGATIYYLEFFPRSALRDGREPVMALMPSPGDVDIVVASELLEAGRAINRGLVTPERTTLIASTHRDYTIGEKSSLGDGRASETELLAGAASAAARLVTFDMAAVAERAGGRISAVIFGAIAGSGVLPWETRHFQAAIRESGVGVEASLLAFEAGRVAAAAAKAGTGVKPASTAGNTAFAVSARLADDLTARIAGEFPSPLHELLTRAVARLVDYQDARYAGLYLDRIADMLRREPRPNESTRLTEVVARSLALWMSFEDVMRVAQVKTRAGRFEQIRAEVRAAPTDLVRVNEFVKPQVEEICATLPAALGRRLLASPRASRFLSRFTSGRRVCTSSISGFLSLRVLASLRRLRRGTLRYVTENARIEQWLSQIRGLAGSDYALAVEVAECQNLVKGYGSTHERGWRSFGEICALAEGLVGSGRGAQQVRALREAALSDDSGAKLAAAIANLRLAGSA